jgi:hypothetical protein
MLNLLRNLLSALGQLLFKIKTGVTGDDRTPKQIENAFDHREITGASIPVWKEKSIWKSYPVKRQWFTFECVAQSTTKHLAINNIPDFAGYIPLSAGFFYDWRSNKPGGGMGHVDAMNIAVNRGSCRDERIRQRFRESDPTPEITPLMIDEGKTFRGINFFEDKVRSLDSVAQIIEERGSCFLWFWFDEKGTEWWKHEPSILFPSLGTYDKGVTRHAVLAVDYGIRDGKKVLKIEDSAGNSSALNNQDRFIDADFMKRCFVSGYVLDLVNPPQVDKPHWKGKMNLEVGMSGDDVNTLQKILSLEGFFNYPEFTNYFGGATRMGVIKLQEKYASEILTPLGLSKGTGVVANATIKWLSANYK